MGHEIQTTISEMYDFINRGGQKRSAPAARERKRRLQLLKERAETLEAPHKQFGKTEKKAHRETLTQSSKSNLSKRQAEVGSAAGHDRPKTA